MRQLSPDGVKLIQKWESCRLTAYRDTGGVLTIGWGHTSNAGPPVVKPGMRITQAEADRILVEDVQDTIKGLYSVHKASVLEGLPQGAYDALVSFVFNLGIGTYKAGTVDTLVEKGDPIAVARKMREYRYDDGKVVQGLINRRAQEASMYESAFQSPPPKPVPQPVPVPPAPVPSPPDRNVGAWVSGIILAICGLIAVWLGWG